MQTGMYHIGAMVKDPAIEAHIEVTVRWLPDGQQERRYEWHGGRDMPILVNRLEDADSHTRQRGNAPKRLRIGPYSLRLVKAREWYEGEGGVYVRSDSGLWNWLRYAVPARYRCFAGRMRCRFIVTLYVWNLAECHDGMIPQWSDVLPGLRKRVQKLVKHLVRSSKV